MESAKLKILIQKIGNLPLFSAKINEIMAVLDDDNSSIENIAKLISTDQAFSVKVLKLANSAYFGYSRQISTIPQAIVILGTSSIKNIAMGISVFSTMNDKDSVLKDELEQMAKYSLNVAVYARLIATHYGYPQPDEVFAAGLLHDLGRIIVMKYLPEEYAQILVLVLNEEQAVYDAETQVIDISHMDLGAYLASYWNFPERMIHVIKYHHDPFDVPEEIETDNTMYPLIKFVSLSQFLCSTSRLTEKEMVIFEKLKTDLNISDETLKDISDNASVLFEDLNSVFL